MIGIQNLNKTPNYNSVIVKPWIIYNLNLDMRNAGIRFMTNSSF